MSDARYSLLGPRAAYNVRRLLFLLPLIAAAVLIPVLVVRFHNHDPSPPSIHAWVPLNTTTTDDDDGEVAPPPSSSSWDNDTIPPAPSPFSPMSSSFDNSTEPPVPAPAPPPAPAPAPIPVPWDNVTFAEPLTAYNFRRLIAIQRLWREVWLVNVAMNKTVVNVTALEITQVTESIIRVVINHNNNTRFGIFVTPDGFALLRVYPISLDILVKVVVRYATLPVPVLPVVLVNGSRYLNHTACTHACGVNGTCSHRTMDALPNPPSFDVCLAAPCQTHCHVACSETCNTTLAEFCVDYTNGSRNCACPVGYVQTGPLVCEDIDECHISSAALAQCITDFGSHAVCVNTYGSYDCWCETGYRFSAQGPDVRCVNRDECMSITNDCSDTCTDTEGSYICGCPRGYELSDNARTCHDSDECTWEQNACFESSDHVNCTNLPGDYSCSCDPGFEEDGTRCHNRNECLSPEWNNCNLNSTVCVDTIGSFACNCAPGFMNLTLSDPLYECSDIDECSDPEESGALCHPNATCVNLPGTWTCVCNHGFIGDGLYHCRIRVPCVNETVCTANHSICIILDPLDECACLPGWHRNETTLDCDDNDECVLDPPHCALHAHCINLPGEFACVCDDGYSSVYENSTLSSSYSCTNINECDFPDRHRACGVHAHCQDEDPGYDCFCDTGYNETNPNNDTCVNMNECDLGTHTCDQVCHDTVGSFTCECTEPGSELKSDNHTCGFVDLCDPSPCGDHGVCSSDHVVATCYCDSGYVFNVDAGTCIDEDECTMSEINPCPNTNMTCTNTPGSFTCSCPDGFVFVMHGNTTDTSSCDDIDECTQEPCSTDSADHEHCTNSYGSFSCDCDDGFLRISSSCILQNVTCPSGYYQPDLSRPNCTDFNECLQETTPVCDNTTSTCVNTDHSFVCACLPGYSGDPCENIDECQDPAHFNCSAAGLGPLNTTQCVDLPGNWTCECAQGYLLNETSGHCADVDECQELVNCTAGSTYSCTNTPGSFVVACSSGYSRIDDSDMGNPCQCQDIDECVSPGRCSTANHTVCVNTAGSYRCDCASGYQLDNTTHNCTNINECDSPDILSNCTGRHEFCVDEPGSFHCGCNHGFVLDGDTGNCENINECHADINPCGDQHAICTDTDGSFNCTCPSGHARVHEVCLDVDECELGTHECSPAPFAICHNTHGSYECRCVHGYELNSSDSTGHTCQDTDECQVTDPRPCPVLALCSNTPGSFDCDCFEGYEMAQNDTCLDIDECGPNQLNDCPPGQSRCVNLPGIHGRYRCDCLNGYTQTDNVTCSNDNECVMGTDACVRHADCIDTPGSYLCVCSDGYEGDGLVECTDIDECQEGTALCQFNSTNCHNLPGSYLCDCRGGFHPSHPLGSIACSDVDECRQGTHNCAGGGTSSCTNTIGGFNCSCVAGWRGNGTACTHINECQEGTHTCASHATCTDEYFLYSCHCNVGWQGQGNGANLCTDIPECSTEQDNCAPGLAHCTETPGSFQCDCMQNFTGNGVTCSPVNECTAHTHACDITSTTCTDLYNGYQCDCRSGYVSIPGNVTSCADINECLTRCLTCNCTNTPGSYSCSCDEINACTNPSMNNCSSHATCTPHGESFTCACASGYDGNPYQSHCTNVNECALGTHDCDHVRPWAAQCNDTDPFWSCSCRPGYTGTGQICDDINECSTGTHHCDVSHGICANTNGSYSCGCQAGSQLSMDLRGCLDIDECNSTELNNCDHAHGTCENHNFTGYACHCNHGYAWNTAACVDRNECLDAPCYPNLTICTNTEGSFVCSCLPGYAGPGIGVPCLNVNECEIGYDILCGAHTFCTDDVPGYHCNCTSGYLKDNSDGTCQPINECLPTSPVSHNCSLNVSTCNDLPGEQGGWNCLCKTGYHQVTPFTCADDDECALGTAGCSNHATCFNVPGTAICTCQAGFSGPGSQCNDIDECQLGLLSCQSHAWCNNTYGSADCICNPGWTAQGVGRGANLVCSDIDECASNLTFTCPSQSSCVNHIMNNAFPNGYSCNCNAGYVLNGTSQQCDDVNECASNQTFTCPSQSVCNNQLLNATFPNGYSCTCNAGYSMNATSQLCQDINECSINGTAALCGSNSTCTNTVGSYSCGCVSGFTMNSTTHTCQDFNECSINGTTVLCGSNSTCTNTVGSYSCGCVSGFTWNSTTLTCQDINECSINGTTALCGLNSTCTNTAGSFVCGCISNYGFNASNVCVMNPCLNGTTICTGVNTNCTMTQTQPYFSCPCSTGYTSYNGTCSVLCTDTGHTCTGSHTSCTNTSSTWICLCNTGYHQGPGASCQHD